MRHSKTLTSLLTLVLAFGLSASYALAGPQKDKDKGKDKGKGKTKEVVYIPKEVKDLMTAGLPTRQGRQDIPFEVFRTVELYAQTGTYVCFCFHLNNADLGFADLDKTKVMKAKDHIFMQFLKYDEAGTPSVLKEYYVPLNLEEKAETFVADKTEWYSLGQTVPAGKYTLAMAVTSPDLKKIGIHYYDFSVPAPETYKNSLDTSSIIFLKDLQQNPQPDKGLAVHKAVLAYGSAIITPNIENVVNPGELIEVFFFLNGAKPKDAAQKPAVYDIEATFQVQDPAGQAVVKWANQKYTAPIISQPLPLKRTVIIKDDKGERQEQKDLTAGKYTLIINIKDNVSGFSVEKKIPFESK